MADESSRETAVIDQGSTETTASSDNLTDRIFDARQRVVDVQKEGMEELGRLWDDTHRLAELIKEKLPITSPFSNPDNPGNPDSPHNSKDLYGKGSNEPVGTRSTYYQERNGNLIGPNGERLTLYLQQELNVDRDLSGNETNREDLITFPALEFSDPQEPNIKYLAASSDGSISIKRLKSDEQNHDTWADLTKAVVSKHPSWGDFLVITRDPSYKGDVFSVFGNKLKYLIEHAGEFNPDVKQSIQPTSKS